MALKEGWGEDYSEALYRAEFQEDRDVASAEVVGAVVAGLGQDAGRVLLGAETPEVKASLRAQTDAAQALGIFGAPTFLTQGELFWGDDRLEDALEWARAPR